MTIFNFNNSTTWQANLRIAAFFLLCTFGITITIQAQCPAPFSVNGALEATGPITVGDLGNCTATDGMIRYNATTMQFEGYENGAWVPFASGGFWSPVAGFPTQIYNTDLDRVGIGTNAPSSKLHIEDLGLLLQEDAAQKIDFASSTSSITALGLHIEGADFSVSGSRRGIHATTSSIGTQSGSATGQVSISKSFGGDGDFIGILGIGNATSLSNSNSQYSTVSGGEFRVGQNTNLNLGNGKFWIAGMRAEMNGTINNTPTTGAVAAVIGIDNNLGTAQSWAGYFEGKGHFSDQLIIGTTTIPTTASGNSITNLNLYVKGGILTEQLVLDSCVNWADYVFDEAYPLTSLSEVEGFIEKEGHLPNVPSAEEVADKGLNVKEITVTQQEKIEELFLHAIALDKENRALKLQVAAFEARLEALEQQ